jgi:hypothetical protein
MRYYNPKRLNVVIEWVEFAFPISEVLTSDIGRDFPQSLQVNAETVAKIRLGNLPSISFCNSLLTNYSHFRRSMV